MEGKVCLQSFLGWNTFWEEFTKGQIVVLYIKYLHSIFVGFTIFKWICK